VDVGGKAAATGGEVAVDVGEGGLGIKSATVGAAVLSQLREVEAEPAVCSTKEGGSQALMRVGGRKERREMRLKSSDRARALDAPGAIQSISQQETVLDISQ
jgi:hypothetical protein